MKKIGIKLADGTFFPILEDGSPEKKEINLTTVKDNQTKVKVGLYRGEESSIDEAEYLDTLEISEMKKHPNGEPNIGLEISLDEKNELSAKIVDKESGAESQVSLSLLSENRNSPKNSDAENSDEVEGVALANVPQDEAAEMNAAETEEEIIADDLPSLDELDLSLPEISEQDETPAEEAVQDSALPDFDFPDLSFDEPDSSAPKNEIQNEPDSANDDLDFSDMNFELPNFDDKDFSSDEFGSNSDGEKKSAAENSFGSFSENNPSSGALDFSDLYDDENEYGENPQDKNQKIPVVVCIGCAIICVLALLAILFVAPMRFNSSGENQTQDLAQELSQDFSSERSVSELPPPHEPVAQIAPPAKENEIVVITETKNVVPDFPPPQEKKSAPKEIVYKIKWGDTLWDLSAAYYKNPWLYPKIARYNNIKNPDYIVAGSTIQIPEE